MKIKKIYYEELKIKILMEFLHAMCRKERDKNQVLLSIYLVITINLIVQLQLLFITVVGSTVLNKVY